MRIIDMVNAKFPNTASLQANSPQANTDFNMFFEDANRRRMSEQAVSQNYGDNRSRSRPEEAKREHNPVRRRNESMAQVEDTESMAGTAVVQEQTTEAAQTTETADNAETAVPIDENQAVEVVAEIMQVPEELVLEWLDGLEMTAQDLTDTQAVTQLLQVAHDAETPVELLTEPEFPENYKAINEAMAELVAEAKPKAAASGKSAVEVSDEVVNVLAEELEGLEATVEDGEIVVTGNARETAAAGARTQSTVQSTETRTAETSQETELLPENAINVNTADEIAVDNSQAAAPMLNIDAAAARVEQTVTQAAAPQQPVNATNVIEQIMNQVKISSSGGQFSEIRMTLRPESLGDIILRVQTQNGIVTAQFEAENQRVKEALEASFNQLRDALQEQGIEFSELSVSVRQDENEQMSQFERARQLSRHRMESIEDVSQTEEEISYHNGVIDLTA